MTELKQINGTWFSRERRIWLASIAGAFFLGMALMNGVATKSATDWAWDQWWHAKNAPPVIEKPACDKVSPAKPAAPVP